MIRSNVVYGTAYFVIVDDAGRRFLGRKAGMYSENFFTKEKKSLLLLYDRREQLNKSVPEGWVGPYEWCHIRGFV